MKGKYKPEVLRILRSELGLSQSEMARILGVTNTSYRSYERTGSSYSHGPGGYVVYAIAKMCHATEKPLPELFELNSELEKKLKEWRPPPILEEIQSHQQEADDKVIQFPRENQKAKWEQKQQPSNKQPFENPKVREITTDSDDRNHERRMDWQETHSKSHLENSLHDSPLLSLSGSTTM